MTIEMAKPPQTRMACIYIYTARTHNTIIKDDKANGGNDSDNNRVLPVLQKKRKLILN